MAMVASLAWRMAASGNQPSKPAISHYALMGPAQTSIVNSKVARQHHLRHRGPADGKIRYSPSRGLL